MRENRNLETFRNMDIKIPAAALFLTPSDHFGIEYDLSFSNEVVEDQVVDETYRFTVQLKPMKAIFDWSIRNDYVRIFYPSDVRFGSVSLIDASGRIEVTPLNADDIFVKSSSGKIIMGGANARSIRIDSTSGSMELQTLTGCEAVIKNTSGSIFIGGVDVTGRLDVATTSGKIELQEIHAQEVSARLTSGGLSVDNCKTRRFTGRDRSGSFRARRLDTEGGVEFESTSGSIEIEGALAGKSRLSCVSGSIKVTSSLPQDTYSYQLSTTSGSSKVNGQKMGTLLNKEAVNHMELSTTSGSIRLDFAR